MHAHVRAVPLIVISALLAGCTVSPDGGEVPQLREDDLDRFPDLLPRVDGAPRLLLDLNGNAGVAFNVTNPHDVSVRVSAYRLGLQGSVVSEKVDAYLVPGATEKVQLFTRIAPVDPPVGARNATLEIVTPHRELAVRVPFTYDAEFANATVTAWDWGGVRTLELDARSTGSMPAAITRARLVADSTYRDGWLTTADGGGPVMLPRDGTWRTVTLEPHENRPWFGPTQPRNASHDAWTVVWPAHGDDGRRVAVPFPPMNARLEHVTPAFECDADDACTLLSVELNVTTNSTTPTYVSGWNVTVQNASRDYTRPDAFNLDGPTEFVRLHPRIWNLAPGAAVLRLDALSVDGSVLATAEVPVQIG